MASVRSTYADNVVEGACAAGQAVLGNPVPVGVVDGSGNIQNLKGDASGNVATVANASASGGYSYSNISTNATTAVKASAGTLHSITINTKGASSNVATVYDNTAGSGTKIATLDTTLGQSTLVYDIAFATGLTIVTATGTAADLTVAYK